MYTCLQSKYTASVSEQSTFSAFEFGVGTSKRLFVTARATGRFLSPCLRDCAPLRSGVKSAPRGPREVGNRRTLDTRGIDDGSGVSHSPREIPSTSAALRVFAARSEETVRVPTRSCSRANRTFPRRRRRRRRAAQQQRRASTPRVSSTSVKTG